MTLISFSTTEGLVKNNKHSEGLFDMAVLGAILLVSGHIIACHLHFISYSYMINNPKECCWLSALIKVLGKKNMCSPITGE